MREVESLLIEKGISDIRTSYVKRKICNRLVRQRRLNNQVHSECSKLAQKEYKTRCDWVGKVIRLELCKRLKFDHITKYYIHKPESFQENETLYILWDFEVKMPEDQNYKKSI